MVEYKIKNEITRVCDELNLPTVVKEEAVKLYEAVSSNNLLRGRTIQGAVATAVYIACRKYNIPRTLDEISRVTGVDQNTIINYFRAFVEKLSIKLPPVDIKAYVVRIGHELNLSEETIKKAIEIAERAKGVSMGRDPNGVAAASIYLASIQAEKVDYNKLLEVAGITPPTLRSRLKEIVKALKIEVPPQYL